MMRKLSGLLLLLACGYVHAATWVSVGTFGADSASNQYGYGDGDSDEMPSSNLNINDIPVFGLAQFDPSRGALTGISISASFTMDVTVSVEVIDLIDIDQMHSAAFTMTNGFQSGVGTLVRYNSPSEPGFTRSLLNQEIDVSVSCSGTIDPCSDSAMAMLTFTQTGNVYDNVNIFRNLLPGDYLGTGNLDGLISVASVLYDGQLWEPGVQTINVLEAIGEVTATINSGTVTLTYTYVPLPGAIWLFGPALGVFGLWRRRVA